MHRRSAGALGAIGLVVALWARTYSVCPAANCFVMKSGLPGLGRATPSSINPLWIQVHPLEIKLQVSRVVADWSGFAIVVHTQADEGVIISRAERGTCRGRTRAHAGIGNAGSHRNGDRCAVDGSGLIDRMDAFGDIDVFRACRAFAAATGCSSQSRC
ncbi:MAG: hypothetical protein KF691_13665 [Phycisphaeraceae bacterium]|nr:hypothetical protein [Phycisphaeraceae bacterium]